jgi:hypothetical protein
MTTKHFKYDERNVAFIDILGFKEMVNISPQDLTLVSFMRYLTHYK